MSTSNPFEVSVVELRRRPGARREVSVAGPLGPLEISSAKVPSGAEITAAVVVEAILDGAVTVTGVVRAPYEGECRRCLGTVRGFVEADVKEVFEPRPVEGETYPLDGDHVDLSAMARDAVLLSLPLAPLCAQGCAGPEPEHHPVAIEGETDDDGKGPVDPRWAGLGQLHFD